MRPLKFRAWSPSKKRWRADWSISEYGEVLDLNANRMDDDLILVQYTGLHDKNGKEIYEGDILDMGRKHLPTIAEVVWASGMASFVAASKDSFLNMSNTGAMCDGQCEVIGNIWENKELLNDSK